MMFNKFKYPDAVDPAKVGEYPMEAFAGGGYFYDDVLEYRVWSKVEGRTEMHAFATYKAAKDFASKNKETEIPIVLVLQREHVNEPEPGVYEHVTGPRITEWQVEWLKGSQGSAEQIPNFIKKLQK